MTTRARQPSPFFQALTSRDVWRRAAPIGFCVGLFQAAINQGDHWLHHEVTSGVILKTILSPLIGLTLSVVSAAAAQAKNAKARPSFLMKSFKLDWLILPIVGILIVLVGWQMLAGTKVVTKDADGNITDEVRTGIVPALPNIGDTWESSKPYIVEPMAKRGELDQGMLRFTLMSLGLVAVGYAIALVVGVPIGFWLGLSPTFAKMFDPIIQILRPVSPLAWLPLGYIIFLEAGKETGTLAALFTIAICSMWPTVLNTAVGVRAVPQDYLNVGRVLKLSRTKTLFKILIPSTLPYMFTGFRLSLGIAWLVIVAAEMLTGRPGVGGFLWQEYNSLIYEHIILSIITIGVVGFILDRLMSVVEKRFKTA